MKTTEVQNILGKVKLPMSERTLSEERAISDVRVEDSQIQVTVSIPSNMKELEKSTLNLTCQKAILDVFPTADVHIHFEQGKSAPAAKPKSASKLKNIIAVASGKGGVGKSTISTYLALSLKDMGFKVGLMDADLYGPSMPTMLGLEGMKPKVVTHEDRAVIVPLEKNGIYVISLGNIIESQQAVVLRGPRLGAIIKQFINETLWPELDYLIVDLPPGTGDIQLTLVQTVPVTGVVIVTTPQKVAINDAIKALNMFKMDSISVPILGVVENMSWFTPTELPDNKYFIFGEGGGDLLAKMGDTRLLGRIPLIQSVREAGDEGVPVDDTHPAMPYFKEMATNVRRETDLRNEHSNPTSVVHVN